MNHRIIVQIYEIQEPREAEIMIELGVDRVGSVIVSEQDWKVLAIREAILVSRKAGSKHSLIPLFSVRETLFRALDYYQPDIIHFCESLAIVDGQMVDCTDFVETQEIIRRQFREVEIMRSIPVSVPNAASPEPTLEIARCFESTSDCFLTDTSLTHQPVEGYIGITGQTGDWQTSKDLVQSSTIPVILAGGLSPENVYGAVKAVQPFGVDSCTGTNQVDRRGKGIRFKKDPARVKAFVQEVRRAEKDLDDLERPKEEKESI